jgi:hypothetical protein
MGCTHEYESDGGKCIKCELTVTETLSSDSELGEDFDMERKRKHNLLLWNKVVTCDDLQYLEKDEMIAIINELNTRLNDVMNGTEWLKNENKRLGNCYIDNENRRNIMKNNGEPAFPAISGNANFYNEGMSLRDYFAAKAMQSLIMADAMLEERSRNNVQEN